MLRSSLGVAALQEDVPRWAHVGVREVALLVSNHSMRVGDRGVVIVGGSAQAGDLAGHSAPGDDPRLHAECHGTCRPGAGSSTGLPARRLRALGDCRIVMSAQ